VHSIDSAQCAMLVNVESLRSAYRLSRGDTPVLDGPMLDGEHGLLGVDGMARHLLHIDFKHCVEIPRRRADADTSWQSFPRACASARC
jgi:hypothetical protein